MTTDVSPQGVRGAGQAPRTRGVSGGRPPGQALLRAAEELFGELSYHRTTVADICARAGMATGSFYSYYGSKAEIFAAVVRGINDDLRQAMRAALEHAEGGQRARERAAFRAYFDMLSERPWIDRIVRESEFIDQRLFREYYEHLARGYARGVRVAQLAQGCVSPELRAAGPPRRRASSQAAAGPGRRAQPTAWRTTTRRAGGRPAPRRRIRPSPPT